MFSHVSTTLKKHTFSTTHYDKICSRWQSRRTCAHLLLWELQNYNLLLNNHLLENVRSHQKKKKIPHIQGQRRSPSKTGQEGAKSHLESNSLPSRDTQRVQTNLVCSRTQRPHRDWARTVFECLLQRYGQQWPATGVGALGTADLSMA